MVGIKSPQLAVEKWPVVLGEGKLRIVDFTGGSAQKGNVSLRKEVYIKRIGISHVGV